MNINKKILVFGFAPFEKSTFESFFRLVGRRSTVYEIVSDVSKADVLIVNGDDADAVQWANATLRAQQRALFVGAQDAAGRWPGVPRPIKLTAILGLLDMLVLANKPASAPIAPPVLEKAEVAITVKPPLATLPISNAYPVRGSVRQGSGAGHSRGLSSFATSNFLGLGSAPVPTSTAQQFDDILVVDDSDIALKFMQNRLTRYGFRAKMVRSGEEALTRVATDAYKFVFLDVMMEGLDGYQTCRAIKQRKYASGRAPVIVMLTSRGGSIDKIRGGLAGCDAYLTKPLNEAELLKVLSKYDEQVERSFRDTNLGGTGWSSLQSP